MCGPPKQRDQHCAERDLICRPNLPLGSSVLSPGSVFKAPVGWSLGLPGYSQALLEIGTIIRSLGCCPSEGELHDLIAEVEEEEPTGYIRFEKFLPVMTEVLLERRYRPIPEDTLLRAFEVLDPSKRGFLTKEELIKYMTEEGEPFSQEEMEEMLSAAIDPESNSIHYKDYIAMMVVDDS
ncbi:dynein regulatory complex protein 8 isoform X1 [Ailuropoda melanoleuca]|uniref:EF-hand calcium binding domain 2 n=1 Tax=Ailuropoda melanoleuca TaxID=9646 RepID=A0A7N5KGR0_AILME|nr:dynein regulatory complex protein 8 isoform X1 [Ailuropoda melanoleuca]